MVHLVFFIWRPKKGGILHAGIHQWLFVQNILRNGTKIKQNWKLTTIWVKCSIFSKMWAMFSSISSDPTMFVSVSSFSTITRAAPSMTSCPFSSIWKIFQSNACCYKKKYKLCITSKGFGKWRTNSHTPCFMRFLDSPSISVVAGQKS